MSDERRLKALGGQDELTKSLSYHPLLKAQSEWPWPASPSFDGLALICQSDYVSPCSLVL